jgi:ABC-2 type transport system ATP-binding protein
MTGSPTPPAPKGTPRGRARPTQAKPGARTPKAEPALEAVGLHKHFGEIRAVDGIDMSLTPGRIYGLLGPNASGKTTLIRLMAGLTSATAGKARVLGVDMPSRDNLAHIGYMTQSDGIYPELSVWENLSFFAALYGQRDRAQMIETLRLVELDGRLGTPALQLSGGMRRRLSMACALAHHPSVIFLDEPTVGVDPALRVVFWDHFHRLAAAGATLLVSSHVMDEADRCDVLLFIRDGRVLAQGTPSELRSQAGTDKLETAFLKFAGEPTGQPASSSKGAAR